jgi:hypothetical protein
MFPTKSPPKAQAVQEQAGSNSVFDRLASSSTISFSKKMQYASEYQQPKQEKVKPQSKKEEDPQHQLEETPSKETVSERIARLEKACLNHSGTKNIFKKKDIQLKKSIDLATVLKRPASPPPPSPPPPQQPKSLYHELEVTKNTAAPVKYQKPTISQSPQLKQQDEHSTQRRSLLDEIKAFQQHQRLLTSPQRKSVDRAPSPVNQPLSPARSNHSSSTEQPPENDQKDPSLEITRNFFNSFLANEKKEKVQRNKSIETVHNIFSDKQPQTNHLDTHIDRQPETRRKFTDYSDTYQRINQLREQIRQASQPRPRSEPERKRVREYEGAQFIDERIKRARKVLKASKEKRRKWLSKR